jgi:hypothetical protein
MLPLLVVASGAFLVSLAPAAQGVPACTSDDHSRFAGWYTEAAYGGVTYEGMVADIDNNAGTVCSGGGGSSTNFIYDWTMVATNFANGGNNRAHVQIGFFQYEGSCIYWATEVRKDDGGSFDRQIDLDDGCRTGTDAHPRVAYNSTTGHEDMSIGGSTLRSTSFNIYSEWSPLPFAMEVSAEGIYYQDYVPGTASNVTNVYDINLQRYTDDWTTDSNGLPTYSNICPSPHRYAKTSIDSTHSYFFFTDTSRSGDYC